MKLTSTLPIWLAFLLGLITTRTGWAQVFEPGTLVLTSGDTLRGEIENRYWESNPVAVRFRPISGAVTAYRPGQVRSFCLATGRCFRSDVFPFDKHAETRTTLLRQGLRIAQEDTRLFAEVLVDGPASLLRSSQVGATHYFVRREARPYLELTERRYLRQNTVTIVNGNNYVAQLEGYFGDCEAAMQAIQRAPFTAEGLLRVVQAYNQQCTAARHPGQEVKAVADPGLLLGLHAGVLVGAHYNGALLMRGPIRALYGQRLDNSLHPAGGIYADVLIAGRRVALHAEATLSQYSGQGSFAAAYGLPAGNYEWQGMQVQLREGLRFFANLTPHKRLYFGGIGVGQDRSFATTSSLNFVDNTRLPFAGKLYNDVIPYVEVGVRQQRFSLTLDARAQASDDYGYYHYYDNFWVVGTTFGYQFIGNRTQAEQ
ncbi:MAG: hypothetical protein ACRYFX_23640 [Janthinobacterium lividum]